MSQEDAKRFMEAALQDKALHKAVHQCVLARDAATLVGVGQQRGYDFTSIEIKKAIALYWDGDVPVAWQDPRLDGALMDPDQVGYFLHPANRQYLMGRRRMPILRHRGLPMRWRIGFATILALVGLFFGWVFYDSHTRYVELRDNGVMVQGEIVGRRESSSPGYRQTVNFYHVTFQYNVERVDYVVEQDVKRSLYDTLLKGSAVNVVYSPSDPDLAVLEGTNSQHIWALPFAIGFGLAWAYVVGRAIYFYRRAVIATRRGQLVMGEITAVVAWPRKKQREVVVRSLDLTFESPRDQRKIEKTLDLGSSVAPADAPQKHARVAIFYVNDWHWWLL